MLDEVGIDTVDPHADIGTEYLDENYTPNTLPQPAISCAEEEEVLSHLGEMRNVARRRLPRAFQRAESR